MKYTIMLVEDEPPILYAIKHLIESGNYGFTVIATAQNGRDALIALEGHAPDVIITDIQMPFMNGLDLIDEVHRRQLQIKCVILTGYSDFEYSRKALRSNAYEYLLKPIQIEQLRTLLESLRETLNKSRIQAEQTTLNNAIFFEKYAKLDLTNLSNRFLVPMIICAGHYAHETWYIDHPGKEYWEQTENLNGIQTHSDNCDLWILNGFTPNERIVIFGLHSLDHSSIDAFAIKLMQQLSKGQIPIQMIYGGSVPEVNELSNEIKKLRMAFAQKIVFGASGIFGAVKRSIAPFIIPSNYENRFAFLAQHKNLDLFKKDFLALLKEWESKKYVQAWIEAFLLNLTNKLGQVHHAELGGLSQSGLLVSEVLSISTSYSELFENYCRFISVIYENADKITDISAAQIVAHMEEYFQNNFTSAISYKMFYDLFGFNETYLSHVFKQQRGITPNKYVTKLRIEKAKEMILLQPDKHLKKIAAQVGYDDAFYFSRVFKEMTGISPSEFIKHSKDQTKL
jgi:two-component system response regulator YesN